MTLILDSKSEKKLSLIKELAIELGIKVSESPKKEIKKTKNELTAKQKSWINELKKIKQDVANGTFKGKPIEEVINEL